MKKDEFTVNLDEKTNILSVYIKVDLKPRNSGVAYYDISRVLNKLKNLGYEISERQCFDKPKPHYVRSDNGKNQTSGTWKFQLLKKETAKPVVKEAITKKTTTKKAPTKKTSRQTTKNVLKSYKKR